MEFIAQFHPKVVHFAIALLLVYALLEAIGAILKKDFFTNAAFVILILGVLGGFASLITGEQAAQVAEKWDDIGTDVIIPFNAIEEHENYATITFFYFLGMTILRTFFAINFQKKKKWSEHFNKVRYGFVVLAIIGCYFVYETGEHGGKLVYKHGVGTDLIKPEEAPSLFPDND